MQAASDIDIENSTGPIPDPAPFSDEFKDHYIQMVYDEQINKHSLDMKYYEGVADYLNKAAIVGFRGNLSDFTNDTIEYETIKDIRRNIFQFSAAKEYQQVVAMSDLIYEKGLKTSFADFKKVASGIFKEFNVNYLKTEFITAVGQAQSARDWIYFEKNKKDFPLLTYHTQKDSRVRDEHAVLDGVTLPVNDKFWNSYSPKNGFRCRCFLTSESEGKVTDLTDRTIPPFGTPEFPEVFNMNPGKDKLIFNPDKHPYFFVQHGDKELKEKNFNLPLP